jgi:hypothetical protein
MKDDLDQLMEQADLDAVLVIGAANHNPEMAYFTGLIHLSDGAVCQQCYFIILSSVTKLRNLGLKPSR